MQVRADNAFRPERPSPLGKLYEDLARETARLDEALAGRLRCGPGCASCCVDEITVFEVEAETIRSRHADLLAEGLPHPVGACAFLEVDTGACRIYENRPYVCRTQGYPLRWIDTLEDGTPVELRDICPINDEAEDPPIETLPESDCWTLGPVEQSLAQLQAETQGGVGVGRLRRVRLRDLFTRTAAPAGPNLET
ncbi:hypothetical protein BH23PLA1_BH23PLA1_09150 [soil metagenome]